MSNLSKPSFPALSRMTVGAGFKPAPTSLLHHSLCTAHSNPALGTNRAALKSEKERGGLGAGPTGKSGEGKSGEGKSGEGKIGRGKNRGQTGEYTIF